MDGKFLPSIKYCSDVCRVRALGRYAGLLGAAGSSLRPNANTLSHAPLKRFQILSDCSRGTAPTSFHSLRRCFTLFIAAATVASLRSVSRSSACSHRSCFFWRLFSRACSWMSSWSRRRVKKSSQALRNSLWISESSTPQDPSSRHSF